ncbi:sensor histidine kinase [Hathewaya limosa]|uniref:histidine kinase n=1 Tax=Hathewaya limosa TaxID=1536 RepID=A0ABU0JTX0_HATLI|nr:HAMP domain-containing sensor histidine kinase [Hathewaya limosa]MDQ0480542.1 signal transduction histidine kinase [Hathewaya limosa]
MEYDNSDEVECSLEGVCFRASGTYIKSNFQQVKNFLNFLKEPVFLCYENRIFFMNLMALRIFNVNPKEKFYNFFIKDLKKSTYYYGEIVDQVLQILESNSFNVMKQYDGYNISTLNININCPRLIEEFNSNEFKLILISKYILYEDSILNNVAHEVRTPLNLMLTSLQLIQDIEERQKGINDNKVLSYMRIMNTNCCRLIRLSENFMIMKQIECCIFNLYKRRVNIKMFLEEIYNCVSYYSNKKNVELNLKINIKIQEILIDELKIEKVLLNILSNAIKYTEAFGKVDINVLEDNIYLIIEIQDNGVGISEEIQGEIFKRFKRGEELYTRENEGLGIGLYISKVFIELHNGDIEVYSKKNEGSKFVIKVPKYGIIQGNEKVFQNKVEGLTRMQRTNIEFAGVYIEC